MADQGEGPGSSGLPLFEVKKENRRRKKSWHGKWQKTGFPSPFAQGLDLPLRLINTQEDLTIFQSDTDKIAEWCNMNKMTMRITREESPLIGEYNMEGQPLESISVYKDLGLIVYYLWSFMEPTCG